jgi:hypothetical protein
MKEEISRIQSDLPKKNLLLLLPSQQRKQTSFQLIQLEQYLKKLFCPRDFWMISETSLRARSYRGKEQWSCLQ